MIFCSLLDRFPTSRMFRAHLTDHGTGVHTRKFIGRIRIPTPIWLSWLTNTALGPQPIRAAGANSRCASMKKKPALVAGNSVPTVTSWLRKAGVDNRYDERCPMIKVRLDPI